MTAQKSAAAVTQIIQTGQDNRLEVIMEDPIAMVFNGTTAAVMMGTPNDLQDLAVGFALTEGYIDHPGDIEAFEAVRHKEGLEARMWISDAQAARLLQRRRALAGPVGCGLCGLDSLEQVHKQHAPVPQPVALTPRQITDAMEQLYDWQPLKRQTRSTHAAGFCLPGQGIVMAREDVGRHNALDKLVGAMRGRDDAAKGAVIISSRLSLELVQKCAALGCGTLIAASGPTHMAIQVARDLGMRLIGFCRGEDYTVFC